MTASKLTSQSYVCLCTGDAAQYVFSLLSADIPAAQTHYQAAGVSDKPGTTQKWD